MKKRVLVAVLNTGLKYLVVSNRKVLCSQPTRRLANQRASEIASEFDCDVCLL